MEVDTPRRSLKKAQTVELPEPEQVINLNPNLDNITETERENLSEQKSIHIQISDIDRDFSEISEKSNTRQEIIEK